MIFSSEICPSNTNFKRTSSGIGILFGDTGMTWANARQFCRDEGGTMFYLNEDETDVWPSINSMLAKYGMWAS